MRDELDEKLCKDFPKLYCERNLAPSETCMYWGIAVGDGWEPLVRELSAKLEAINHKIKEPKNYVVAAQVKSKFGTLRFYTNGILPEFVDEVNEAIALAEHKSSITCEQCGAPGSSHGSGNRPKRSGWIKTICDACEDKLEKAD